MFANDDTVHLLTEAEVVLRYFSSLVSLHSYSCDFESCSWLAVYTPTVCLLSLCVVFLNSIPWSKPCPISDCGEALSAFSCGCHENLPVSPNLGDTQLGARWDSWLIPWVLGVNQSPPTHMSETAGGAVIHRHRLSWHFPNRDYCLQPGSVRGNQHPPGSIRGELFILVCSKRGDVFMQLGLARSPLCDFNWGS